MAVKKKAAKKRPKQRRFPEMADGQIKAVEDAADNYYDVMMERCELSKSEHELKSNLIAVMAENGVDRYELPDGRVVMVTGKKYVKIAKPKKAKKDKAA